MLPAAGADGRGSYRSQRPVSDKEELARAALRSLADPSTAPPAPLPPPGNDAAAAPPAFPATRLPPPLPSQSLATQQASSSATSSALSQPDPAFRSSHDDYRRPPRSQYSDHGVPLPSASHHMLRHASLGDELIQRNPSSSSSPSSFFNDQQISASPDSSPRLEAAPIQMPRHTHLRHSIPASTQPSASAHLHEVALRRASIAMGVDIEQVRDIVHHAMDAPHAREPHFVRQVLDAYRLESDRASQPLVVRESWQAEPPRSNARNHVAYPSRYADPGPASRSAYPAYHDLARGDSVASGSASASMMPISEHRPESPSPFAYDAHPRSSQPSSDMAAPAASYSVHRPSHAHLDEASRHHRAFEDERFTTHRSRYPAYPHHPPPLPLPQTRAPERRVRSIDDYLDAPPQLYPRRHQRRGSMADYNGRTAVLTAVLTSEYDDERYRDRLARPNVRHSFHPYASPSSRYLGASADAIGISPQLSPTMGDAPRPYPIHDHRSPLLRSPAGESSTSVAGSVAALTPSPLLGVPVGTPDDRKRSLDGHADAPTSLRSASEDTAAESTRAGVARLQIDDSGSKPLLKSSSARTSRSSLASHSSAERQVPGTDLSHSQIMQKLQNKVKGRLAAKKKAAAESAAAFRPGGHKAAKPKRDAKPSGAKQDVSAEDTVKAEASKSDKVSRAGSTKRTASSISTSDRASSPQPSRPSVESSSAATADTSATPSGNGMPAPKVRRTSASSQQKPSTPQPPRQPIAAQLSPRPASTKPEWLPDKDQDKTPPASIEEALQALDSKTASKSPAPKSPASKSPAPTSASPPGKNLSPPTSISAALLSPTDSPTPTEAAAMHARRMSRSPLPPGADGAATVETSSGQALPGELPGAGQMNASSATKQQTSKAGIDSLIQSAQANDPTETNSAIA
ncbi:hypothetical protein PaG_04216 [Moesziomyces aphidis]|uniref:Uncharacterized protein n=1 Tax=Moesziomyces aphidis TaxID=84754 RepID=W3VJ69_MOEAP|nr:hypothetical protein PaG_04216 [Moesziomyces aphidis]